MPRAYSWDGITCSYDNGTVSPRIVALNLSSSGLAGVIVPDISRLERLQVLDLSNNNLSGPVPAFLAQLQFLRILDLSNNQLTGPIPSELVARTRDGLSLQYHTFVFSSLPPDSSIRVTDIDFGSSNLPCLLVHSG
ncbi:PREDICTED: probable LRR receptor-like serine/threonine-protein kinase At1g05700 [Tarenaya hassleriana]|uniref:probable LRR receptor-like serine/threonine-protein kinase At1g05700 n=1 Tax=Tarenaya hassleriana TaxID=28532 RepID=UPI00053C6668|nr:PREDICTED: probable LRR receptor-like serine/threonine-protein kinase At1g05700 [Tarenaya hassleriana]